MVRLAGESSWGGLAVRVHRGGVWMHLDLMEVPVLISVAGMYLFDALQLRL
jgi:hypothetical protein